MLIQIRKIDYVINYFNTTLGEFLKQGLIHQNSWTDDTQNNRFKTTLGEFYNNCSKKKSSPYFMMRALMYTSTNVPKTFWGAVLTATHLINCMQSLYTSKTPMQTLLDFSSNYH